MHVLCIRNPFDEYLVRVSPRQQEGEQQNCEETTLCEEANICNIRVQSHLVETIVQWLGHACRLEYASLFFLSLL
jgi:hypothetical protein